MKLRPFLMLFKEYRMLEEQVKALKKSKKVIVVNPSITISDLELSKDLYIESEKINLGGSWNLKPGSKLVVFPFKKK